LRTLPLTVIEMGTMGLFLAFSAARDERETGGAEARQ
jgi:hypothetical protein